MSEQNSTILCMYLCKLQLQNTLFHLIQAAGHHPVYVTIDHTKEGPIPAPPSEHFVVQYATVCSGESNMLRQPIPEGVVQHSSLNKR